MTRPIKFRAWVEGKGMFNFTIDELLRSTVHSEGTTYSGGDMTYVWTKGTKMQFTGLHDRNGVYIYEGDVYRLFNSEGIVLGGGDPWKERHHVVQWTEWNGNVGFCLQDTSDGFGLSIEVIGNIYEDPHLLQDNSNT